MTKTNDPTPSPHVHDSSGWPPRAGETVTGWRAVRALEEGVCDHLWHLHSGGRMELRDGSLMVTYGIDWTATIGAVLKWDWTVPPPPAPPEPEPAFTPMSREDSEWLRDHVTDHTAIDLVEPLVASYLAALRVVEAAEEWADFVKGRSQFPHGRRLLAALAPFRGAVGGKEE